jgi:type II secretory pathway pseudopilin PulG
MSLSKKKSVRKSFTLVEMVVSISVFSLIMVLIWGWQKDVFSINNLLLNRISIQDNLRKTIKSFIDEVRTAQLSATGAYYIEEANKDEFIFFSDIDHDNTIERVRYFLDDRRIKKGVIKPSGQPATYNPADENIKELINYIVNADNNVFFYYDKNYDGQGNPLIQPVDIKTIRLVKIYVTINQNPDRPPESITETSQTSIRNLKDNL